jgi:hypothetical protein
MTTRSTRRTRATRLVSAWVTASAAITLALAVIAPAAAVAHTASYSAQHSISLSSAGVAGQLTSAAADCISGRQITLYRADTSGAVAVASATGDTQGAWSRSADALKPGAYYAIAARVVKTSAGHKHTCEAARSNTLTLAPDGDGDGVRDPSDNCPTVANAGQRDRDGDGAGDACDADADGDGYTAAGGDCADDDPARHPGALDDTRNGVDDDCDGNVDEDAPAADTPTDGIVYSDTYKKLIAAFPSGYADECDISRVLHGAGGFCDARIDVVYFYPDGTLGPRPWHVDTSSATGWSVEPDPCDGLTEDEYLLWAAYVDHANGYLDSGPDLTTAQIDRYEACWGWWF